MGLSYVYIGWNSRVLNSYPTHESRYRGRHLCKPFSERLYENKYLGHSSADHQLVIL